MSQRLTTRFRKDGASKGVAIRKNKDNTPKMMKVLFNMAYRANKQKKRSYGKSKSKAS